MKKIVAFEADFAQEYFSKKINATQEELTRAQDLYQSKDLPSIYSVDGDTANIQITGPLSRSGPDFWDRLMGYGGTKYGDIIDSVKKAESDVTVKKIQLQMDTPGGEVTGVDEVWQTLSAAKKKKVAINNGMIASAGYYIASACNNIYATEPTSETGSIGCVITAIDWSENLKMFGVKIYDITSKNAPKKRPDISTKEGRNILQERVNAIENVFIDRVATGRKTTAEDVKKNFGQGALLIAENPDGIDAVKVGMIDGLVVNSFDNEIGTESDVSDFENNKTPLTGENTEETMELNEFLAQNPDAKAKYDADIKSAEERGAKAEKESNTARIKKVVSYIDNENYPGATVHAKKVLSGEMSIDAFEGSIVAFDMMKESQKSKAAKEETEATGDTPPQIETPKDVTENKTAEDDMKKAARYS